MNKTQKLMVVGIIMSIIALTLQAKFDWGLFLANPTRNCGEGCNNNGQCISGYCDSVAGGFCAPTNAPTGCVNDYQCVLDLCADVTTTTTTVAGQCYDEYLGWVSVGVSFSTGCCSGSSCSRNGFTWGYNEAGIFDCVSDQQWSVTIVDCGTTTTSTTTTLVAQCYDEYLGWVSVGYSFGTGCCSGSSCTRNGYTWYTGEAGIFDCVSDQQWSFDRVSCGCPIYDSDGNIVEYKSVGTQIGTGCIDGWLWLKTCMEDGMWDLEQIEECGQQCLTEGSMCGLSAPGTTLECCSNLGLVCEFQIWENVYKCVVSEVTTTTTLLCPEGTCEWVDSQGNVVECKSVGTVIGTMCIDGWFWEKTCMESGEWEQVKVHECVDYDNVCNIPTPEGGFDVISECESFSNCGILGRVTDLGAPVIKAINEAINPFRALLGLPETEFETRCEICSSLYKHCKINECEVQWTICRDNTPGFMCDINSGFCKLTAEFMNFKVIWGEFVFWLIIIIGILALLVVIMLFTNVFSTIMPLILRRWQ